MGFNSCVIYVIIIYDINMKKLLDASISAEKILDMDLEKSANFIGKVLKKIDM